MDRDLLVYVDLDGKPCFVGRLWTRVRAGRESASFEYDRSWLAHPERFSLEPALELGPAPFHTTSGQPLFGAIGDSAPDRWGRVLMRRAERRRAQQERRAPRTVWEGDYLLLVDDEARQGALRFADRAEGPFLADGSGPKIPPLVKLPALLTASQRVLDDKDSEEDLRLLLAPGSSLGGARPKASVRDRDGALAIAKFPHAADEVNTMAWEAVALTLAAKAGIAVPTWRLETVSRKPVLLSRRFDRVSGVRVPFLSAMSMLGARDNETRSYLELADALRRHGASPNEDRIELWRRIVFTVLISNTDDHLRNHGFLWTGPAGWRLSPAYDINPVPPDIRPRILTTAIDMDDATASLDLAWAVAPYFGLRPEQARAIAAQAGKAVSNWRKVATAIGIRAAEIDRMAAAFDHDDLKSARRRK